MDGNFTQWDLVTYPGLIACVVAIVGALKKFFPKAIEGKEPYIGLTLSYVLGIAAKLTIPGAYAKIHWLVFLVTLLFVAVGAKLGHDYFVNQILKGKSPDQQLDDKVTEKVDAKIAEIKKA